MSNFFNGANERDFLNSLVSDYKDSSPYSQIKKDVIISLIDKTIEKNDSSRVLQMGCSNGYETEQLAKRFKYLDVIDGASAFIDKLKKRGKYENVNFIDSLFEDYEVTGDSLKYDYIFCNYVLEHVFDPVSVLKQVSKSLKPTGLLFIVVPNLNALSRKIAQKMGLISSLEELTENDLRHGHRRVYSFESIIQDVQLANFRITESKGIVFKILADFQLNQLLNENFLKREHIFAMQALAEEPDNVRYSDSIYLVAQLINS